MSETKYPTGLFTGRSEEGEEGEDFIGQYVAFLQAAGIRTEREDGWWYKSVINGANINYFSEYIKSSSQDQMTDYDYAVHNYQAVKDTYLGPSFELIEDFIDHYHKNW